MDQNLIVNEKTGEVMPASTPDDLLQAASEAARALERVIQLNDRPPLMFNGKRYLEFHHWLTISKFYHVTVKTYDAMPVEIGGVLGFKARAEAIDERSGSVVGSAEAYCMRDEPNWKSKPTFQLVSMAQTRAAAKALSNKFRFVAIVAGYEGTPSEEMIEDKSLPTQVVMPKRKEAVEATTETPQAEEKTSKFWPALQKIVREKGIASDVMRTTIYNFYMKTSSKELTDAECSDLIKRIEKGL